MEIKSAELRNCLALMQYVVPRKPTLTSLTNVLFKDGKAVGTDLETMITIKMPQADGEFLIPQRKALEVFKYVPGEEVVTIRQVSNSVEMSWNGGSSVFEVPPTGEFPDTSEVTNIASGDIPDGDSMVGTLKAMLPYISTEESRPLLKGVIVSFGEEMEISASDGFRMAYQVLQQSFPSPARLSIPGDAVKILCSLWAKVPPPSAKGDSLVSTIMSKRPLNVSISKEKIGFDFGRINIVSRFVQGEPPNFSGLIPKDPPISVTLMASEMERCLNRIKGNNKNKPWAARVEWGSEKISLKFKGDESTVTAEAALYSSTLSESTPARIAINGNYLLDYFAKKDGVATISIHDDKSPALFRYGSSPLVVMMPMAVEW